VTQSYLAHTAREAIDERHNWLNDLVWQREPSL